MNDLSMPEVTLVESARAARTDLGELAAELPGDAARRAQLAEVADRLAEELAEIAAMTRALPGSPAEMSGHDRALLAALRTAHAAREDVAATVARALARLAAELGGSAAVLANRSGSWEAGHIRGLLAGTVGEDDEAMSDYRTTP